MDDGREVAIIVVMVDDFSQLLIQSNIKSVRILLTLMALRIIRFSADIEHEQYYSSFRTVPRCM